jgi:hypothetical protein
VKKWGVWAGNTKRVRKRDVEIKRGEVVWGVRVGDTKREEREKM